MALDPALAAVRLAARRSLESLVGGRDAGVVVVACSGGADSLALLAATVFEAASTSARVVGVTVDHGLQAGSAEHAEQVVAQMAGLGVDESATIRVTVDPGPAGIEAGAREARYAALSQFAATLGARVPVLLGHTLDDQAETVLLGLTRGSGGRSLQGMRVAFAFGEGADAPLFARPLLAVTRAQTEGACLAEGIVWWEDPHNSDPRFTRARIRHEVMPMLEREMGPGVAGALARTAESVREDVTALDLQADAVLAQARAADGSLDLAGFEHREAAIITRVIRSAAIAAGAIPAELTREHVLAVWRVTGAPGKEIQLPGHLTAYAEAGALKFRPTRDA